LKTLYFEFAYTYGLIDSGRSATESIRRYEAYSLLYLILTHPNSTVWNRIRNTTPRITAPMPFGDVHDIPAFHIAFSVENGEVERVPRLRRFCAMTEPIFN